MQDRTTRVYNESDLEAAFDHFREAFAAMDETIDDRNRAVELRFRERLIFHPTGEDQTEVEAEAAVGDEREIDA